MARARADAGRDRWLGAAGALFFVVAAAATVAWARSMPGGLAIPGGWTLSMAWMRMGSQSWPGAAATYFAMWLLMMVAMTLPSLVPMLAGYGRSIRRSDRARLGRLTALAERAGSMTRR